MRKSLNEITQQTKTLKVNSDFEIIDEEFSINIQGGKQGVYTFGNDRDQPENIWLKATSILDDLV
jgi:hypothetical protein